MTFLQIINIIKETALAQPNVNTFVRNFLDLNREDTKYSAIVLQDRDGLRDRIQEQDWNTFTFHLGYVDRLTFDESNRDDIFSTGVNIINNIVASLRQRWFPDIEVSVIDRFSTFDQRFTASCAGVYVVLAIQIPVSDCVDSEQTDIYDTYQARFTENGHYHYVPDGRPYDEIDITIDVEGSKPEETLTETITTNGSHRYDPTPGSVFSGADISVDVHPSQSLSRSYTTNGTKTITGEFNGGTININVHPSQSLVQNISTNGSHSFSGEWTDAEITVAVPVPEMTTLTETLTSNSTYSYTAPSGQAYDSVLVTVSVPSDMKPESICDQIIQENGSHNYDPPVGEVFNAVHITTDVHPSMSLVETITTNGSHSYSGEWTDAEITVAVPIPRIFPGGIVSISDNGGYGWYADEGTAWSEFGVDVDVHPSMSLVQTISSNGVTSLSGEWKDASITVDVHPSTSLSETYTTNGTKTISGEFKDGTINIDVHPSQSLVQNISLNGSHTFTGEWTNAVITVSVPEQKPEERLLKTLRTNGTSVYYPTQGAVFEYAYITTDVHPSQSLVQNISTNGTTNISGEWTDAVITTDVHPSQSLVQNISANGSHTFTGEWTNAVIAVDVHPSMSLVETITTNGSHSYSGEWTDAVITTDVHPSQSLVQTITTNGVTSLSGEWTNAVITVAVPTTLTVTMTQSQYDALSVKDSNTIYLING